MTQPTDLETIETRLRALVGEIRMEACARHHDAPGAAQRRGGMCEASDMLLAKLTEVFGPSPRQIRRQEYRDWLAAVRADVA